jgi:hypothetical protein
MQVQGVSLAKIHPNAAATLFHSDLLFSMIQSALNYPPESCSGNSTGSAVDLYGMLRGHGCKPTMIHIDPERTAFRCFFL